MYFAHHYKSSQSFLLSPIKGSQGFWSVIFGMVSGFNWELLIMKMTVLCLIFFFYFEEINPSCCQELWQWVLGRYSRFCIPIYAKPKILIKKNTQKYLSIFFISFILSLKYYKFLLILSDLFSSRQCEFHAFDRVFITLLKPRQKCQWHKRFLILQSFGSSCWFKFAAEI